MEPKNNFKCRSAEKNDFNSIKELLFAGFLEQKDFIPQITQDYLQWCEQNDMKDCESFWNTYFCSKNKSGNFWVVEDKDNGKVIATVGLESKSDDEAELRRMSVAKDYRRHGLGNTMLDVLLKYAKQENFKFVSLSTIDVLKPALKLYTSNGFEFVKSTQLSDTKLAAADGSIVSVMYYKKMLE